MLKKNIVINNVFDEYYYLRVTPDLITDMYGIDHSGFISGIDSVNYGDREIGNKYITVNYRRAILEDNMALFVMLDPDDKHFEITGWIYFNKDETEALSIRAIYNVRTNKIVFMPIGTISKDFRDEGNIVGAFSAENVTAFMENYSIDRESIEGYYHYFLNIIVEHWTKAGASRFSVGNWGTYTIENRILIYFEG